ncbi:hypothetical protein LIER_29916 [Lithospermum erythrorhizon]|uniref:Uncharacterized protein n=1 Tax=Lithospermum erythrorhizon TaxID=34254 RepID=A0AAV3RPS8_LITER
MRGTTSISEDPHVENPETEEDAEVFAAYVLTESSADVTGNSKVTSKKRKKASGEGPKRNSKKTKVPTIFEGIEGAKEAPPIEPKVRESQTLEGFRRRIAASVIAKGHLRHRPLLHPLEGINEDTPRGRDSKYPQRGGIHPGLLGVLQLWAAFEGIPLRQLPSLFDRLCTLPIRPLRMGHSNGFPNDMLIRGGCPQYKFILQDVQCHPSRSPFLFPHSIGGEEHALLREAG